MAVKSSDKQHPSALIRTRPDLYDFLGLDTNSQSINLAKKILGKNVSDINDKELTIFKYIVEFWKRSTLDVPYMAQTGKGANLARRPFLSPNGSADTKGFFSEQYRWDTFFQNVGLILAGGTKLAKDQLLNLIDTYKDFGRIPNALTSSFLSHAQPPLESKCLLAILEAGEKPGKWSDYVVKTIEAELQTEWWDINTNKKNPRQTAELLRIYGPQITRHTSVHYHPLLVGCEDGKDHYWVTAKYGEHYLPVQLNAIIYGIICDLTTYYSKYNLNSNKVMEYKKIQNNFLKRFNELFWLDHGKWKGYCNYSIREDEKGQIRYGDLGAQIWPLFVKAASLKQAEAVRKNLKEYYAGDIGLATTSERLKKGSSIPSTPKGGWVFQWEVNCWPPLMYVAIEGLKNYSKDPSDDFAKDALLYQTHWIKRQIQDIQNSGSLYEKSPYHSKQKVDGGYYGTLKGFGWTVGTFLSFAKDLSGNYSFFNHKKNHGAATDT